jgi:hypothetical protein
MRWISRVAQLFSEITVDRFRRRVQHVAVDVVFPTVIDAAQTTFFIAPKKKRRAAVGAMLADETDTALRVAEGDQLFAQQFYPCGRTVRSGNFFR